MSKEYRNSSRPRNSRSMIDNESATPSAVLGSSERPGARQGYSSGREPSAGEGNPYPFERSYGGPSGRDERPGARQGYSSGREPSAGEGNPYSFERPYRGPYGGPSIRDERPGAGEGNPYRRPSAGEGYLSGRPGTGQGYSERSNVRERRSGINSYRPSENRIRDRNWNRQSRQESIYINRIKDLLSRSDVELNNYFENIYDRLKKFYPKRNEDLKDIMGVFLWTFDETIIPVSIQKQVLLLNNITQLIRELNRNFNLNLSQLKLNKSQNLYESIIRTFISSLNENNERFEDMDKITNNFFYLLNIMCDERMLENIFKTMNINSKNKFIKLKRNSVIKKAPTRITPNIMEKSFYHFMGEIFQHVNQINTRGEIIALQDPIKITIIDLISSVFDDQTNLINYVNDTYLVQNKLNQSILLNLQKKLFNMSLRYYLPISYLLTDRHLKRYTQSEINTIIERVGERKGAQGFVNIHRESRTAEKYLNMRINTDNEREAGDEESTFYKVREGNTKSTYTRINNTIPAIILIEYIIHSYLYRVNQNYVSRIDGIKFTNNVAQIHYGLINGYNPKQLLSKPMNRRSPNEEKLIQFIYQGNRIDDGRPLFSQRYNRKTRNESEGVNLLRFFDSPEIQNKFRIPEHFDYPQIRTIYFMIFEALGVYQNSLNFVHSDFGLGNMMFDIEKIETSATGEYVSLQDGFIKIVDFELSSIFIPFDNAIPDKKYLVKKIEQNYTTIVRNFVKNADNNPVGIKIYDIVRFILIELIKNIYDHDHENYTPTEFIYTMLQYFGRPFIQINYKDLLIRFHQLFVINRLDNEAFKNLCQSLSRNYILRNYVFFGIIPTGYTQENVISYLQRYYNKKDNLYFSRVNCILPPPEDRPDDIIPGYRGITFSDLFTPEYLLQSFST